MKNIVEAKEFIDLTSAELNLIDTSTLPSEAEIRMLKEKAPDHPTHSKHIFYKLIAETKKRIDPIVELGRDIHLIRL